MAHFQTKISEDVILSAFNNLMNRYLAVDTHKLYFCCIDGWDYYVDLIAV